MESLPNSLWPMPETRGLLAAFDNLFLLSYVAGLAVLMWVSWHRLFREPYSLADDRTDKVLRLMPPGDLRGTLTVLRAYLVYSLLVGGSYSVIALAGAFLYDIALQLRLPELAGLSLPDLPFEMDEPAWPLAVSLAFIGIFDRIPKVQAIEITFRRWAYRSIGIPPFIKERTLDVIGADLMSQPKIEDVTDREAIVDHLHALAAPLIGTTRADKLRVDLRRLGAMGRLILDDRAPYPSADLRTRFHPMLREIASDSRELFDEVEGVVLLLGAPTTQGDDALDREQTERKRLIDRLADRTDKVHWDMCTLMAVLVENETSPDPSAHPALRGFVDEILTSAVNDTERTDRFLTIAFASVAVAFVATWIAIGAQVHAPWGRHSSLGTAAIESLLISLIVLPALVTGLAMQDARSAKRQWARYSPGSGQTIPISQYSSVFLRGVIVTLPLVALFYAVYLFGVVNAQGDAAARFQGTVPAYVAYAVIGGIQAVAAAYTVGDVEGGSHRTAVRAAGANALAVAVVMVGFYIFVTRGIDSMAEQMAVVGTHWFTILRMAVVCGLATYLTARIRMTQDPEADHPAGDPFTPEAAT